MLLPDDVAAAGTPLIDHLADRRRRARVRDHLEPARLPERVRHRPRGLGRARRRPRAVAGRPSPRRRGTPATASTSRSTRPDMCPRWAARVFTDVKVGPSPAWMKARIVAAGHAADLERRRHHQLRDAARPASRRTRSTWTRSPGREIIVRRARRRRAGDDPRRPGAHARRRDARDRRRREAVRGRRA